MAGELHIVSTGDEALEYVHQRGEYTDTPEPALILLDWHLPGTSGEEVLTELKADQDLKHIPVIAVTGSESGREIRDVYTNHANACVTKPSDPDALIDMIRVIDDFWRDVAQLPTSDERDEEYGVQ